MVWIMEEVVEVRLIDRSELSLTNMFLDRDFRVVVGFVVARRETNKLVNNRENHVFSAL